MEGCLSVVLIGATRVVRLTGLIILTRMSFLVVEVSKMLKVLGYEANGLEYHYKKPNCDLDKGLQPLASDIGMNVEWVGCNEAEVEPSVEFQDEEVNLDAFESASGFRCCEGKSNEVVEEKIKGQIPVFTTESHAMFMDSGLKDVSGLKDTTWLKESCGPSGDASGSKLVKRKKTK
ncbi:hypothetical protein Tco_0465536, partial [Tanacetum coccineum]